jgi:hypothetical protein
MTAEDQKGPPLPPGPSAPSASSVFLQGIYLQKRKSSIGTGGTAKTTEYRNFWATGSITGDSALMILLDDSFKPTTVRESFRLSDLTEPTWFFIAEGEKKYQFIRPLLDKILAAPPKEASAAPAPAEAAPAPWWGGGAPSGPPANPFEIKKTPQRPAPKKGGWWDK